MKQIAMAGFLVILSGSIFSQSPDGSSPGIGGIPRLEADPYYFATGFEFGEANDTYKNQIKFEVGLKYNALGFNAGPVPVDFLLLYYQTSFFHIYDLTDSQPMYDHRYNFATTIRIRFDQIVPYELFSGIRLTPFHHESNGGDLLSSRGWDRATVAFDFGSVTRGFFALSLFVNAYVYRLDDANTDLHKYLGIGGATATLNILKLLSLGDQGLWDLYSFGDATVRATWVFAEENLSNIKLEVFYNPITTYFKYFERKNPNGIWSPSLYFQWFYGKGENLRDYKDVHNVVRVGLATVL